MRPTDVPYSAYLPHIPVLFGHWSLVISRSPVPMPHQRSRARDVALQLLYQHELNPRLPYAAVQNFVHERLNDPDELEPLALALYEGVLTHRADIDRRLARAAENWKVPRMAVVDRNVLRL